MAVHEGHRHVVTFEADTSDLIEELDRVEERLDRLMEKFREFKKMKLEEE